MSSRPARVEVELLVGRVAVQLAGEPLLVLALRLLVGGGERGLLALRGRLLEDDRERGPLQALDVLVLELVVGAAEVELAVEEDDERGALHRVEHGALEVAPEAQLVLVAPDEAPASP